MRENIPRKSLLKNKIVVGSAWALVGKFLAVFLTLVINVVLANILPPKELGAYFLAVSIVSGASMVAQLGLNQTIVWLVAEYMSDIREAEVVGQLIRLIYRYSAIGALIVFFLFLLWAGEAIANLFRSKYLNNSTILLSIWIVGIAFQSIIAETFRGFQDIRFATLFGGLFTRIISSVIFIYLWITSEGSNFNAIITFSICSVMVGIVFSGSTLRKKISGISSKHTIIVNNALLKQKIWHISLPLMLLGLSYYVLTQADLWVLGTFAPQDEVAVYGATLRLVLVISLPLSILNSVIQPAIAELHFKRDTLQLEEMLRSVSTISGVFAIAVLVIYLTVGSELLEVLYGDYYKKGYRVLVFLGIGHAINVMTGSCGLALSMTGHQQGILKISGLLGSVTIVGLYFAAKHFGIIGVAAVTAFSVAMQNIIVMTMVKSRLGVWTVMYAPNRKNMARLFKPFHCM